MPNRNLVFEGACIPQTYVGGWALNIPDSTAANIIAAVAEINSFSSLSSGWRYGAGGPITREVINASLKWADVLVTAKFTDLRAFPGADREILLAAQYNDSYIELIIETDETISLSLEKNDEQKFYKSHITPYEAQEIISQIAGYKWTAYAFYTPEISMPVKSVSSALRSATHQMEAASQLYLLIAPQFNQTVSVTTSDNTTLEFQESLPYFGSLTHPAFLPTAP